MNELSLYRNGVADPQIKGCISNHNFDVMIEDVTYGGSCGSRNFGQ
jgi:hypothetical protein